MPALTITITTAGAQALAQVGGSVGPVELTQIQIGNGVWTTGPTGAETALKSTVATLAVSGASVPTPGTIHLTATDTTNATYAATEIGVFTSTGILFAIYAQSSAIFSKAAAAVALVAVDLLISALPPGSVTASAATFGYPTASTTAPGVAEIAQLSDLSTGTDNTKIVTALLVAEYCGQFAKTANNLSDLTSAATARANLSLGTAATQNIPASGNATSGQVVFGTDTRLADARNPLPASVLPSSLSAPAIASLVTAINTANYPVGQIYISYVAGNPSTLLSMPGTTWATFGPGRVLVGISTTDANFATAGQTGGEDSHALTTSEMPAHDHLITVGGSGSGGGYVRADGVAPAENYASQLSGSGIPHNNLQPYITVYFWQRTA